MQQNISSGLIFVVEGDRQKFVYDENFPIYGTSADTWISEHLNELEQTFKEQKK